MKKRIDLFIGFDLSTGELMVYSIQDAPIYLKAPYCEKSEHRLDTHVAFYFFHLLARPNNRAQAIYFRSHTNCLYLIKVVLLFGCGGKKESFHRPDCAP